MKKKNYKDDKNKWHVVPVAFGCNIFAIDCPHCKKSHKHGIGILDPNYNGKREFTCFTIHKHNNTYIIDPVE